MFSPDGKWLAFVSDESGSNEVYVQPFGYEGVRSVVSAGGGVHLMWDHDGKRLYYSAGDVVMQVASDPRPGTSARPRRRCGFRRAPRFGITPAGDFIGVRTLSENFIAPELEIATEWFRELSARVPVPH